MDALTKAALERVTKAAEGRPAGSYCPNVAEDVRRLAEAVPEAERTDITRALAFGVRPSEVRALEIVHQLTDHLRHLLERVPDAE